MDRKTLVAAQRSCLEALEAAHRSIGEAGEDADLDALEAAFEAAEQEHDKAKRALARFDAIEAAKADLPVEEEREADVPEVEERSDVRVKSEPLTYERGNGQSFFRDLYRRDRQGDRSAGERLERHMQEARVEGKAKEQRALSSTDSAGGYLVAPIYLQNEFAELARAGRPTANAIGSRPLPPNTDSINIPKMDSGTATAAQSDNGSVEETDATFGTVAADVKTIAGMQDVSRQLLDRSVPGVDDIIFADLVADYNTRLDVAVLNSSTSNNKGILQVTGINSVTYTDGSPTVAEAWPKFADAVQKVHTTRFLPPDFWIMHPRRWAWFLAALDTTNRPLITPYAPQNAAGLVERVGAENVVGGMQGLPVVIDSSVPATNGAGTNEDAIALVRRADLILWEDQSGPYLETFPDVGSGTLTVRFRLYNYYAQCHERQPKGIAAITGTGLAAPTF